MAREVSEENSGTGGICEAGERILRPARRVEITVTNLAEQLKAHNETLKQMARSARIIVNIFTAVGFLFLGLLVGLVIYGFWSRG